MNIQEMPYDLSYFINFGVHVTFFSFVLVLTIRNALQKKWEIVFAGLASLFFLLIGIFCFMDWAIIKA